MKHIFSFMFFQSFNSSCIYTIHSIKESYKGPRRLSWLVHSVLTQESLTTESSRVAHAGSFALLTWEGLRATCGWSWVF